ncbi:MAG: hybrid sensor histidine kinase/response regulator [Niabella sp.]|nr:MAG: hybrid sensor histidine kinase/response regulator [Niabella sp.]
MISDLRIRLVLLYCLIVFFPDLIRGQDISFRSFLIEHGLPSYSVISITQDKKGFMWLGTSNGLSRYDGVRFKNYNSPKGNAQSISNKNILSLCTDSKGVLWAGASNGLNKYNESLDRFETIRLDPKPNYFVYKIFEDRKGYLWIGTSIGLFYIFNGKPYVVSSLKNESVKAIYEDSKQRIWIGTDKGVRIIEKQNNNLIVSQFNLPANSYTNLVSAFCEDINQNIWMGTQNGGVFVYNPSQKKFKNFVANNTHGEGLINNNIRCIFSDKQNNLWLGTQEGISILNPTTYTFKNIEHHADNTSSLSQNSVYSIFQDNNGSIWVGTYFGGVNQSAAYTTPFFTLRSTGYNNSISNNVVSSIVEDSKENLWIGTEGGGLNVLEKGFNKYISYKHQPANATSLGSNLIKVAYPDKDGNIWVGTHGGGLNVFIPSTKNFKKYFIDSLNISNSEIFSITEDGSNNLWVSSNAGLFIYKRSGTILYEWSDNKFSNRLEPRYLFKDSRNNIWIAEFEGVQVVIDNQLKSINNTYTVNCFAEDKEGNIWMGTSNNGLLKFDYKKQQLLKIDQSYLNSINILGILIQKDGSLWISTQKGLVHFNPYTTNCQVYTVRDGIAGNEFNYNSSFISSKGYFYFGGFNGITYFQPSSIQINPVIPAIAFTAVKLHNKELQINDEQKILKTNISNTPNLVFAHDQNVITIEFALLNFIKAEKNIYQYRLNGIDENWNQTRSPSVTYNNLPPGSYKLTVKAANNDGVWSKPISISIKIKPPFWQTWWAYCFYIISAAAILFVVIRFFFLRELLKKEDELHQAKLNFFTNVSHEIRTHLTLIIAPIERLLTEHKKDNFIHQQLSQVKSNANRLLYLVSELMDFRKAETNHLTLYPQNQNLIPFLQDIYASFRELSLSNNISMSFVHDQEKVYLLFDEKQLEKVFFNLLTNAFKFTPPGGKVDLQVTTKYKSVSISVTDNGRGIDPNYQNKLFTNYFQVTDHGIQNTGYGIGLALSKKIVEYHQGQITVQSTKASEGHPGKTVFTVSIPRITEIVINEHENKSKNQVTEPTHADDLMAEEINKKHEGAPVYTVLIVEDNSEIRTLIKETLQFRYKIITAENGALGLAIAQSEIPDIIISDVMMPEMDGFELCKKLKTDEHTSHIPVILLTAKSSQSEQITGLEHGADVYLTKPFSTKILLLNVQNIFAAKERMRSKTAIEMAKITLPAKSTNLQPSFGFKPSITLFQNNIDNDFLDKVISIIDEHIDDPNFGVDMLSRKLAMSTPVVYKKLRALTNMSVNGFIKQQRFKKAAILLLQKNLTINEVSFAVGYDDRKYFSREFKKYFGVVPSEYNEGITQMQTLD